VEDERALGRILLYACNHEAIVAVLDLCLELYG
jgi:hypothetical protein